MAVPARPTSGVPIETAWGQVAHDTAVAMDIQAGIVTGSVAASGTFQDFNVTFTRAFSAAPTVVVAVQGSFSGIQDYVVQAINVAASGFTVRFSKKTGATLSALTMTTSWIAYGPRA